MAAAGCSHPLTRTHTHSLAHIQAATLAGLKRVSLLQEPVAAAMAFGFGKPYEAETILVFDLGGGTYDVSLLDSFEGIMEVGFYNIIYVLCCVFGRRSYYLGVWPGGGTYDVSLLDSFEGIMEVRSCCLFFLPLNVVSQNHGHAPAAACAHEPFLIACKRCAGWPPQPPRRRACKHGSTQNLTGPGDWRRLIARRR